MSPEPNTESPGQPQRNIGLCLTKEMQIGLLGIAIDVPDVDPAGRKANSGQFHTVDIVSDIYNDDSRHQKTLVTHMRNSLAKIRKNLGSPYYEDDDILIYSGDALSLLEKIPHQSISLTVTSPPYNIGKEYEDIKRIDEYILWSKKWIDEIYRITSPTGSFWLNLGYTSLEGKAKAIPLPYLIWNRVPFFLIQEVVWNYGAGVAGRLFFSPRNEKLLWYVKDCKSYTFNLDDIRDPRVKYPNQKKNGKLKCNPRGKNPTDVWQIAKVTSGRNRSSKERTSHPAQFPIELIKRVVLASSNIGEIVLDPFVGSGSTLEAAIRTGRAAIGFDLEPRYLDIAVNRVKNVREQMHLEKSQTNFLDDLSSGKNGPEFYAR